MQEERMASTIDPYYKKGNVFERDEAYYSQMLSGKRTNLRNSARYPSPQRTLQDRSTYNPNSQVGNTLNQRGLQSNTWEHRQQESNQYRSEVRQTRQEDITRGDRQYMQARNTNIQLRAEMERLISGNADFGLSDNVVKLSHYNISQGDLGRIKEQETRIRQLEQKIEENKRRLEQYRKAGEELNTRMHNIQSIDKEIYKTLQGSVNRDRELLDRASSALARGDSRADVARILQQIIG